MKTRYTNKQLSEMIKSDKDAEVLKQQMLDKSNKLIQTYDLLHMFVALNLCAIAYLIYTLTEVSTAKLLLGWTFALVPLAITAMSKTQLHMSYREFIKTVFTPINESKRCTRVEQMINEHVEASKIQEYAIQNGRQLYNFDADNMEDVIKTKIEELAQQHEKEACKKVHGIPNAIPSV